MKKIPYKIAQWMLGLFFLSPISCVNNSSVWIEYISKTKRFSNYSTVDWAKMDTLYYRPYNSDWDDNMSNIIERTEFPVEIAGCYWHLLQNAKTAFNIESSAHREIGSKHLRETIDHSASLFDTVFVRIVSQEYYTRIFPDVYNEVMEVEFNRARHRSRFNAGKPN